MKKINYTGSSKLISRIVDLLNHKAPMPLDGNGDNDWGTNGQVLTTDGNGNTSWTTPQGGGGDVTDVEVNGTSVVNAQGVAEVSVPTNTSDLNNDSDFIDSTDLFTALGDYTPTASLASVATSGQYSDLSGTPSLATVATSGDYDDLTNKPTIPAAQVNSDWSAVSGVAEILNKPTIPTALADLSEDSTHRVVTDTEKTTWNGKVSDNPTFTEAGSRANIASGESFATILGKIKKFFADLKTVAFTGAYADLSGTPTIPSVGNGTLTIQKNGTNVQTFTANQSGNATANITVPTNTNELTNGAGFITSSGSITGNAATADNADTVDGVHYLYDRYVSVVNGITQPTAGEEWGINIKTPDWHNVPIVVQLTCGGNNFRSDVVVYAHARTGHFWGYQSSYNGTAAKGIVVTVDNATNIHVKLSNQVTSLTLYKSFSNGTVTTETLRTDYVGTDVAGLIGDYFPGNAGSATKATQDGSGNTITSTYVKKAGDTMSGILYIDRQDGTTTTQGYSIISLGNNKSEGTDKNSRGMIRLYGTGAYYSEIIATNTTANKAFQLPNASGTFALKEIDNQFSANQTIDRKDGTTTTVGVSTLYLGSYTTSTQNQNSRGRIVMYGENTNCVKLLCNPTLDREIYFPDKAGTVALTSDLSSYLPLAGGTMTGQIKLASNGYRTSDGDGYSVDTWGNFKHLSSNSNGYFAFQKNNGTDVVKITWESGNLSAGSLSLTKGAFIQDNNDDTPLYLKTTSNTGECCIKFDGLSGGTAQTLCEMYVNSSDIGKKGVGSVRMPLAYRSELSSRRYKENIVPVSNDEAEKILDVEIVSFDYKEGTDFVSEKDRKGNHGVIAEDVASIIPSAVTYADIDGEELPTGVNYTKFIPYLIKMVQIQQDQINALTAEIATLKGAK